MESVLIYLIITELNLDLEAIANHACKAHNVPEVIQGCKFLDALMVLEFNSNWLIF